MGKILMDETSPRLSSAVLLAIPSGGDTAGETAVSLNMSAGRVRFSSWEDVKSGVEAKQFFLIDLRSPKEFQNGHIPHAVNVPLLDDEERHQVGLTYKTIGRVEAIQLGLEIFSKKVNSFLAQIDQYQAEDRRIVLHCWRGGMRSQLVGRWLGVLGFDVTILYGGYKVFRKKVIDVLQSATPENRRVLVLNGRTGAGKTDIIRALLEEGLPVVDLEGLACHRGSVFGGFAQLSACPSQQTFENLLAERLLAFKDAPLVLIEIENYIGPIAVPMVFRRNIYGSDMILISRVFSDRVERLESIYVDSWNDATEKEFLTKLKSLRKFLTRVGYDQVVSDIQDQKFAPVISTLLSQRYDVVYDKGLKKNRDLVIAEYNISVQWDEALSFLRSRLQPIAEKC